MTNTKIFFYIVLLLMCSCGSPRFAKDGVFVNDVDEYFNPRQDINVWVYGNFHPYIGLAVGVRLGSLYSDDKLVLKAVGLKNRSSKILFSSLPSAWPSYNLLAIQHRKDNVKLAGFEKINVDSSYYYQKDFRVNKLDVRQIYIPYGKKALSLVYYIDADKNIKQPFSKLEYLARINAEELQHRKQKVLHWKVFDCTENKQVLTDVPLPKELLAKHKRSFLKIYADYGSSTGIQYFQILEGGSTNALKLKLCPARYIVELSDTKYRVIQTDTLVVK